MPAIDAVIFDCDGVLVDSEILAHEIEMAVLSDAGLLYDPRDFKARFMGMSDTAFHAALYVVLDVSSADIPAITAQIAAVTVARAVASSSTRENLEHKLRLTGLWDLFSPHVYSAEHVAQSKPAPDLFLYAATELGIAPSGCLVLEDSVNGVLGARAAGMQVWGFAGGAHMDGEAIARLTAAGAERVIADWPSFVMAFAPRHGGA
ncbi:MAG: HAD-IA family hydrolase [Alphaproteobacteria bacterium]|nr:HAD-IA family hydrolase [Alphaproteobacteria bacterium]